MFSIRNSYIFASESLLDQSRKLILRIEHVDLHASPPAKYRGLSQLSQVGGVLTAGAGSNTRLF
jgi:hypothetical protein